MAHAFFFSFTVSKLSFVQDPPNKRVALVVLRGDDPLLIVFVLLLKWDMYSDGERKTVSELLREAEATRNQIIDEARQLAQQKKVTAKVQFSIDQLFRFFAREAQSEEEKKALVDTLLTNAPDVYLGTVPLIPITIAIANGRMTNARRIFAVDNPFVEDSAFIFLVHVLRFSPQAAQIEHVDVSGTAITEKGLTFALEMMLERDTPFALVAKCTSVPSPAVPPVYRTRYQTALINVRNRKNCTVVLE